MNCCENFKQLPNIIHEEDIYTKHEFHKYVTLNEFSKGCNRIIFLRSFRRLVGKAQMYSNDKGDHFRTRLTHTLEVAKIARSLAKYLRLDEDLTEAIALGHDIGHAAFGHQGEKTLNEIMCKSNDLRGKIKVDHGGFKHNYNSLRILDIIERSKDKTGLNLSWQIMEGILKHTNLNSDKYNIDKFVNDDLLKKYLCVGQNCSVTLEGQIVAIADEIAQRQHDLDDGMRDDLLNFKVDDVYNELINIINKIILKYKKNLKNGYDGDEVHLNNCINLIEILYKKLEIYKDNNDLDKKNDLVKAITEYFVLDVLGTTINTIKKNNYKYSLYKNNVPENISNNLINDFCDIGLIGNTEICKCIHIFKDEKSSKIMIDETNEKAILKTNDGRKYNFNIKKENGKIDIYISIFNKKIVRCSDVGRDFDKEIEKYIRNEILTSDHLNKFDGKGRYIILCLFKAYHENPFQMPHYMLDRLKKRIDENAKIYKLKLKENNKLLNEIDFKHSKKDETEDLFNILKLKTLDKLITPEGLDEKILDDEELLEKINKTKISEISECGITNKFIKCLLENNYAYLSTICDYIAGMTDNYAIKEYKKLYLAD